MDIKQSTEEYLKFIGPYETGDCMMLITLTNEVGDVILNTSVILIIIQCLVNEGFATYNNNSTGYPRTFQLTDKGRKLKELGTFKAYDLHLSEENEAYDRRKIRENQMYWIQFWIATGACAAATYYVLEILRIQYHFGLPYHVHF